MCLIAGGLGEHLKPKLIRMIEAGKHRGKDSFGVWTDEGVLKSPDFSRVGEIPDGRIGILQCRLAMTGSKGFTQPFFNDLTLVHNGEIYNHVPLREWLEGRGVSFESDVDTEVILRLIEYLLEKGLRMEEAVRRAMVMLNGDYAVAITNGTKIYLFRDPIGIRPLHFSPRGFFASERKVLWAVGEEAHPVLPGELVVLDGKSVVRKRLLHPKDLARRGCNARKSLKAALEYAVRLRTPGEVAVLFSGGLDSSLLALIASKYGDVSLYTAGEENSPDVEWARRASDALGLPLREYLFEEDEVEEAAKRVIFAIEEPNPMNLAIGIPLYFATKLARENGDSVLLSGQGADELFGGYAKYLERPELMEEDVENLWSRNLERDDKIAMLNSVEGRFPYLDPNVVGIALGLPLELKIASGVRKKILRDVALELGLPEEFAMREKKACQYGSHSQRLLRRVAKRHGFSLRDYSEKLFRETFSPLPGRIKGPTGQN
ncbi:DUF7411 family protein [Palaeococcus ferrophilus]|uniref:DUF7411 family protein n=1 Tax=Palaeococcus ferrophilus TaxID=83868 RepID=UPI00064EC7F6|nr:asparagine synthase-related protein [Palaeococcus ferrophilus]